MTLIFCQLVTHFGGTCNVWDKDLPNSRKLFKNDWFCQSIEHESIQIALEIWAELSTVLSIGNIIDIIH